MMHLKLMLPLRPLAFKFTVLISAFIVVSCSRKVKVIWGEEVMDRCLQVKASLAKNQAPWR
jgi:hypothetical protein